MEIRVEGLEPLLKKLDGNSLLAAPLREALTKAVILLESAAKRGAPVDTGRLRASITHEVDSRPVPLFGKVGTDVFYAPYVEFGTRPHWPPVSALATWARRHGFASAFIVARTIAARGTKARHMFRTALEDNRERIEQLLREAGKRIEEAFNK